MWHFDGELNREQAAQLTALGGVTPRDISADNSGGGSGAGGASGALGAYRRMPPPSPGGDKPYNIKPAALLSSAFEEVSVEPVRRGERRASPRQ